MALNPNFSGLSCFACGQPHHPRRLQTVCTVCGLPLRVDYDFAAIHLSPIDLSGRPASLWRYAEVLPIDQGGLRQGSAPLAGQSPASLPAPATAREVAVSLVEGWTPLIQVEDQVWIKDESRNPTGSFKARGMALAVSMARALGADALCAPSAGNAASALAAYGAAAHLPVVVAMPADTPLAFVEECRHYGAEVHLVEGTIADAGRWLREHGPAGAFDVSTLREPYRIEGKKTLGYELFEQLGGLPAAILYPTGGGTGLIGMWKAFGEMAALGWIGEAHRPRLVSVQAAGCAPVVSAFLAGADKTAPWPDPHTAAYGLRVPSPIGGFLCLRALRETGGTALSIPEDEIARATAALARRTGLDICPEGGAAWAGYERLRDSGWLPAGPVVVFNTGTGLKYR